MGDLTLHDDLDRDAASGGLVERLVHRRFQVEYDDHDRALEEAVAHVARLGERLRLVRVRLDGVEHGHAWLVTGGDDLTLVDLLLDDHHLAAGVRELLFERARAEGLGRLAVMVTPGDPVLEAFALGGGFEVAAYQMRLPLDDRLPAEPTLVLRPMTEPEHTAFMAVSTEDYIAARVKSGESPEHARKVSEEQMATMLPDGADTVDHHFFVGEVEGERVGILWLGTERPMAFVYDVIVDEHRRREGHGAALMRAGALFSRDHGSHALGLNVFGYNHGAKALYDRLGYHVVEEYAAREL